MLFEGQATIQDTLQRRHVAFDDRDKHDAGFSGTSGSQAVA